MLTDSFWCKGTVSKNEDKVALWLGANVMVEFSFDEASVLLNKNLENAFNNLTSYVI